MKTERFDSQPKRSVFQCGATPDLLATLQGNPGQSTPFSQVYLHLLCLLFLL